MAKKSPYKTIISKQLEEHIDVPFHVVGTPEWINESLETSCIPNHDITQVHSATDLEPCKKWLGAQPELGLDSETGGDNKRDGLDPVAATSRMLIFQLGTPKMVYLVEPKLVPEFKGILQNESKLFLAQNGVHDFKFMFAKYGIHFINYVFDEATQKCRPSFYDTMLAEQLITAGLLGLSVGLEELAERYPPHRIISKEVRREFIDMRGRLEYRHLYYAARDVFLLFAIRDAQSNEIKKHSGMWERMQVEFCAVPGTADAELTGFDLDEVRISATVSYYQRKAKRIRKRVNDIFDEEMSKRGLKRNFVLPDSMEEFDMDSPSKKLTNLRLIGFDLEDTKRETLLKLESEITTLLGEYTECTKIISTYGERMLAKRSKTTGRLHPEFNQLGAGDMARKGKEKASTISTGRWSSDAQQFPRPEHILDPLEGNEIEEVTHLFEPEFKTALKKLTEQEAVSGKS